ncbi:MAG: dihydropteroate synthase [Candidatus Rokubacteria bacterium]|nr:dihydropteroate synthase [Candidatus Rokubacteria bacterium]
MKTLVCGRFRLPLGQRPLIMGILNVTPDSFSDGGLFLNPRRALARALQMQEQGADLIDVGGESTRPGARPVPAQEETRRILPVIERLADRLRIPISVDTAKAAVARQAIQAGACLVNDVTGLRDLRMPEVVAQAEVPVILMHTRGTARTMRRLARYRRLIPEILVELKVSVRRALAAGIRRDRILIDPGIGFAKGPQDNLRILQNLRAFKQLGFPVVVGPSRKSFIGHVLGVPVEGRLFGTAAAVTWVVAQGVEIVRVHDVAAMRQVADLTRAILAVRPPSLALGTSSPVEGRTGVSCCSSSSILFCCFSISSFWA